MNGLQIATWVMIGLTFVINGYTFWRIRRTAKMLKRTRALNLRCSENDTDEMN